MAVRDHLVAHCIGVVAVVSSDSLITCKERKCNEANSQGIDMLYSNIKEASSNLFTQKRHFDKHISGRNDFCKEVLA